MRPWLFPVFAAPLVVSCAAPAPELAPRLPVTIEDGRGSALGNYPTVPAGEIIGPEGTPCPVFLWDRPLSDGRVIRQRSASCAFAGRPGGLIAIELDRQVIPLAQSTLRDGPP